MWNLDGKLDIYKGFIQGIQKGKASTTILGFMMEKVNFWTFEHVDHSVGFVASEIWICYEVMDDIPTTVHPTCFRAREIHNVKLSFQS